jgi:hypothetical protein
LRLEFHADAGGLAPDHDAGQVLPVDPELEMVGNADGGRDLERGAERGSVLHGAIDDGLASVEGDLSCLQRALPGNAPLLHRKALDPAAFAWHARENGCLGVFSTFTVMPRLG